MIYCRCILGNTAVSRYGRCAPKADRIMPHPPMTAGRIEPVRNRWSLRGNVEDRRRWRRSCIDVEGHQWMRASPSGRGDGPRSGAMRKSNPRVTVGYVQAFRGVRNTETLLERWQLACGRNTQGRTVRPRRDARAEQVIPETSRHTVMRRRSPDGRASVPTRHPLPKTPVTGSVSRYAIPATLTQFLKMRSEI